MFRDFDILNWFWIQFLIMQQFIHTDIIDYLTWDLQIFFMKLYKVITNCRTLQCNCLSQLVDTLHFVQTNSIYLHNPDMFFRMLFVVCKEKLNFSSAHVSFRTLFPDIVLEWKSICFRRKSCDFLLEVRFYYILEKQSKRSSNIWF